MPADIPMLADIRAAADRIAGKVLRTPVLPARGGLNELTGSTLYFKAENLQRAGAFKFRGACNALAQLDANQRQAGVITHSSGNHAAALALAGQLFDVPVQVVMPKTASEVKVAAVQSYGGRIHFCEPTQQAREERLADLSQSTGAHFVPPYDDWRIICGQGTAALELVEDQPDLDVVIAPVGGGGLLSGTAIAVKGHSPDIVVIGAEPVLAGDAHLSFVTGRLHPQMPPRSIADGLLTALSERTFEIIRRHVDAIQTVSEIDIVRAMRLIGERLKLVVEPSAAVPLALVLSAPAQFAGRRVGIILSGGNLDLQRWRW